MKNVNIRIVTLKCMSINPRKVYRVYREALVVDWSLALISLSIFPDTLSRTDVIKTRSSELFSIRNAHCRISFNSLVRLKIAVYTMRRQSVIPRTKGHAWTSLSETLILSSWFCWTVTLRLADLWRVCFTSHYFSLFICFLFLVL